MRNKLYLGDGLYCEFDGFQFRLWTQRESGVHEVFLDNQVLKVFLMFVSSFTKNAEADLE